MKKCRKTGILLLLVLLLTVTSACGQQGMPNGKPTECFSYVFDAGTYTSLDYAFADAYFAKEYDNYGGGCTAVAKVNRAGDTIVGRNMDLNISNKAAYVVRTEVEGCYRTLGLVYTFRDISPDYREVQKKGLPKTFAKVLPFMADDVLNEKGLYVEINMRNAECWPTGDAKFSCSGTNPASDKRVYLFELPRYLGEHCATVEEALEYVKTLNVYSKDGYWTYCFLLADATGRYGVLEFAQNRILWQEGQQAQANFYIDPEMAAIEQLGCGMGRYDKVMEGIAAVETEEEMFALMDSVAYSQIYDPENCRFDYRSEHIGAAPYATKDYVMAEEQREMLRQVAQELSDTVQALSRQELQDRNEYWESSFTEVINCNAKTLFVRFFEDNEKTLTLRFDSADGR